MPVQKVLSEEPGDLVAPYIAVDERRIFVGDRIRIRDLVSTGLTVPEKAGKRFKKIQAKGERIIVADVSRVMIGAKGEMYVLGQIVEAPSSVKSSRIRHQIGTSAMRRTKNVVKEVLRHPDFGPSDAERDAETPVAHSTRVRTEKFRSMIGDAVALGIPERYVWEDLAEAGDAFSEQIHRQVNKKLTDIGKDPLPDPDTYGKKEFEELKAVRAGEREPEWWMFPALQAILDDPSQILLRVEWMEAA